MVKEVVSRYAPLYEELSSAKSKADINEIIQKYGYPRNTFWRICRKYFQSGFADSSLVDTKRLKTIKKLELILNILKRQELLLILQLKGILKKH